MYGSFHEIRWQKIWVLKGIKSDRLNKQNDQNEHNPFIEYHKSILNYMLIWCLCQNVRRWWTINIQHSIKCWYFKFQIAKKRDKKGHQLYWQMWYLFDSNVSDFDLTVRCIHEHKIRFDSNANGLPDDIWIHMSLN